MKEPIYLIYAGCLCVFMPCVILSLLTLRDFLGLLAAIDKEKYDDKDNGQ